MNLVKKDTVEETFILALQDADMRNVAIDVGELALDSLLDEGLLKDVPVLGVLVKVVSASATIADKLFLKKLLSFLLHLQDIPAEDRAKVIKNIDDSKEYRTKVGEKLLYIIDACEDHETAELVSKVFRYFLQGQIKYDEFIKTAAVLQRLNIADFKWLVREKEHHYFDLSNVGELMHTGLFELYYDDVRVDIREKHSMIPKESRRPSGRNPEVPYETEVDGGVSVHLSRPGEIIMEVFSPNYKKKNTVRI